MGKGAAVRLDLLPGIRLYYAIRYFIAKSDPYGHFSLGLACNAGLYSGSNHPDNLRRCITGIFYIVMLDIKWKWLQPLCSFS